MEKEKKINAKSAKERILHTAGSLFYQYGFRAIGIDRIIKEADVAKMTFYKHFASKDVLIGEILDSFNEQLFRDLKKAAEKEKNPSKKIIRVLEKITEIALDPQYQGCIFQKCAGEFDDKNHPGIKISQHHKNTMISFIESLLKEGQFLNYSLLAKQIFLLVEGVWASCHFLKQDNPAHHLVKTVNILIGANQIRIEKDRG